jgi:transcriptional regulator GlxA family with amidase domain
MYVGTRVLKSLDAGLDQSECAILALQDGFKVTALARRKGVSKRQLERLFRTHFGITPHGFLVRVRLQKAKELLLQGLPVKVVAISMRYKQMSHFSREFKRFYGCSPRNVAFR